MENCYVKTNDYSRWVSELAERHRQHDGPPPSPHNFFLFPADFTCSVLTIWPNPKYKTTYFWNKAFFGLSRGETAVSIKSQSTDESRGGFIQIVFLGSKYTHTHKAKRDTDSDDDSAVYKFHSSDKHSCAKQGFLRPSRLNLLQPFIPCRPT